MECGVLHVAHNGGRSHMCLVVGCGARGRHGSMEKKSGRIMRIYGV